MPLYISHSTWISLDSPTLWALLVWYLNSGSVATEFTALQAVTSNFCSKIRTPVTFSAHFFRYKMVWYTGYPLKWIPQWGYPHFVIIHLMGGFSLSHHPSIGSSHDELENPHDWAMFKTPVDEFGDSASRYPLGDDKKIQERGIWIFTSMTLETPKDIKYGWICYVPSFVQG